MQSPSSEAQRGAIGTPEKGCPPCIPETAALGTFRTSVYTSVPENSAPDLGNPAPLPVMRWLVLK
jgi:hypothetical protein